MAEKLKIFLFAALFIVCLGIVVIGILISHNLSRMHKRSHLQTLLYQQVFLYTFFLYGAWGRIFLSQALMNLEVSPSIINKASFYLPFLGLPFLVVSWYMLIRFFYEIKGDRFSRSLTLGYFIFYGLMITLGAWYINTGNFRQIETPEIILIRLLAVMNLVSNVLIIPAVWSRNRKSPNDFIFPGRYLLYYLIGVLAYSVGIWFIKEHYWICVTTILVLFSVSALIPVFSMVQLKKIPGDGLPEESGFAGFCCTYKISKREAEIIQEICAGKSNQAIAETLFITLQTVKDHVHRIYTKTGAKNRIHLANLVRETVSKK
jgi:DNA-binding CsgD family transcriptional regulator